MSERPLWGFCTRCEKAGHEASWRIRSPVNGKGGVLVHTLSFRQEYVFWWPGALRDISPDGLVHVLHAVSFRGQLDD